MQERLTIKIIGKTDSIAVSTLVRVLSDTERLLRSIEHDVGEPGKPHGVWVIKSLSKSSPIAATIVRDAANTLLTDSFFSSLSAMNSGAVRPDGYTDDTMDRFKRLASVLNDGAAAILYSTPTHKEISPTQHICANVDEVLNVTGRHYFVDSEVEGRLYALRVHGDRPRFIIYDPLDDTPIPCDFSSADEDEVISLIRDRVRVFGRVKFSKKHEIRSVDVYSFRRLREKSDLPQIDDLHKAKINITGGMNSSDYIQELRDGR